MDTNSSFYNDRAAVIKIGGVEYPLLLTTKATKEISRKYGGLADLGEKLLKAENFELALDEIIWLITLMVNQSILIHNLQHPNEKRELLTEELMELLTTPFELAEYKNALMEAMMRGTKRNILSDENDNEGNNTEKNTAGA